MRSLLTPLLLAILALSGPGALAHCESQAGSHSNGSQAPNGGVRR